jgi:hypothetical protein
LSKGENENDFEDVEVHVADGIQMGNINDTKVSELEKNKIFEEEVLPEVVEGIEAKERTFLNNESEREIIEKLINSKKSDLKTTLAKLKKVKDKSNNITLVEDVLKRIKEEHKEIPEEYNLLFNEVWKVTPISQLLPSHSNEDLELLKIHLAREENIFESLKLAKQVTEAFPVVAKIITQISKKENTSFPPIDVTKIIAEMVNLKMMYNTKMRKTAQPRKKPAENHKSAKAEVYPNLPIQTMKTKFAADKKSDKGEEKAPCGKYFNESPSISGGFTHITCKHGICKGDAARRISTDDN